MTRKVNGFGGTFRIAAVLAVGALGASGCALLPSGLDEEATEITETTAVPTTGEATSDTTGSGSPEEAATVNEATWDTDPQDFRDQVGEEVNFSCPAGGSATTIWGVEVYTDDSSVCTAAVHVGLLSLAEGGSVTIEILGPLESYEAGIAHDIESKTWGSWEGSFSFPAAPPGSGTFDAIPDGESWSLEANASNPAVGDTFTHTCAPDGVIETIWGTGTYTGDSSICTAAVHAGLITTDSGGQVTVLMTEGLVEYEATEANGVSTSVWGSYDISFEVS